MTSTTLQTVTSADGTTIAYEKLGSRAGRRPRLRRVGRPLVERRPRAGARERLHGLQLRPPRPRRQRRHAAVRDRARDRGHRGRDRRGRRDRVPVRDVVRRGARARARPAALPGKVTKLALWEPPYIDDPAARPPADTGRDVRAAGGRGPAERRGRVLHGQGRRAAAGVRRVREDPAVLGGPGEDRPHPRVRRPDHGRLLDPAREGGDGDPADDRRSPARPASRSSSRPSPSSATRSPTGPRRRCRARSTTWLRRSSARFCRSSSPADAGRRAHRAPRPGRPSRPGRIRASARRMIRSVNRGTPNCPSQAPASLSNAPQRGEPCPTTSRPSPARMTR